MYEVRCTRYDLEIRARCAGEAERERGDVLEPRSGVVTKRREEMAPNGAR